MPLGDNSRLVTDADLRLVANNNRRDTIANTAGPTAFAFSNGLSGDDRIQSFGKSDTLLNFRKLFDLNDDGIIDLGRGGVLDIDRTSSRNAGPDQITLQGVTGNRLRYLGEKEGRHVYADASVRLAGWTEGTVGDNSFDAGSGARTYFYDTALGLNLGGDTIANFGSDDRIVTTTAINDGGAGSRGAPVTLGANGVLDLSGEDQNAAADDGAANGGQVDLAGVSSLYLLSTQVVNGVTYYSYGTESPNRPPAAPEENSVTTDEDTASAPVAIGSSDADGDALTYSVKPGAGPAIGTVSFDQSAGTFTYTPDANANGSDAFTIVITDGFGGETEQVVSVTVTPVNDAPTAPELQLIATDEDTPTAAVAIGASDMDGDTLTYSLKPGPTPNEGTVTFDQAAGTFTYTPNPDENGVDGFTILISDGNGGVAEQDVIVRINSVQDPIAPVDLDDVAAGVGGFKIVGEAERDRAGWSVSEAGDVNGDGLGDLLVGAYLNDGEGLDDNGAAYVVFGKSDGGTVDLDDVAAGTGGFKIRGEADYDYAGYSVSDAGDVNGDGLADLLVGAPLNSLDMSERNGAAYVVFGKSDGSAVDLRDVAAGTGGFKIGGEAEFDRAGISVSAAGDVNGDGLGDLLVGAPYGNGSGLVGAAYVVFGKGDGTAVDLNAVAAGTGGFKISGERNTNEAGYSVSAAGDLNGDGLADLLVGAPTNSSDRTSFNGAVYVVFGKSDGATVDLRDVAAGTGGFKILGEDEFDQAGLSVSAAGDVNGDGVGDLLVGTVPDDGASYVVFGKSDGAIVDLDDVAAGTGGFKILQEAAGDEAGYSVSAAGDLNRDGLADFLVGAPANDSDGATDNGAIYVVFGKSDGAAVDLRDVAAGIGGFKILGEAGSDDAGFSVSAAGDVNGDGLADLLVGAPLNDGDGATDNGAAYLIFGSPDWLI